MTAGYEWIPIVVAGTSLLCTLVIVPLVRSSFAGEVSRQIAEHDKHAHAHPNLHNSERLEARMDKLGEDLGRKIDDLRSSHRIEEKINDLATSIGVNRQRRASDEMPKP